MRLVNPNMFTLAVCNCAIAVVNLNVMSKLRGTIKTRSLIQSGAEVVVPVKSLVPRRFEASDALRIAGQVTQSNFPVQLVSHFLIVARHVVRNDASIKPFFGC